MLRHALTTGIRLKLAIALLLGAVALAAPAATPAPAAAVDEPPECQYSGSHPTIRRGDFNSEDVAHAQCLLNFWGDAPELNINVVVDGDFGKATKKAVKKFQRFWDLEDDGVIGPCTWAALHPGETPKSNCFVT